MTQINYDFDAVIDRRNTGSDKWDRYEPDVLPFWVADMDFRSPPPVIEALHRRVEHGVFGYTSEVPGLREVVVERLRRLYGWTVEPDAVVPLPGVVPGVNLACLALARPGESAVTMPPVYAPILGAPALTGLTRLDVPLTPGADLHYELDLDAFEAALTPQSKLLILCNPHNPVGRVFTRAELQDLAEICLQHGMDICSDEIHCDLLFGGYEHTPIAALAPEIGARTITLIAPSKTFNIPGLKCSFAVIPNPAVRARFNAVRAHLVSGPNVLGAVAALAAYEEGGDWLAACLSYLEANRDFLVDFIHRNIPDIHIAAPEGTYLAWLDCRALDLLGGPYQFFLKEARVALGDGSHFGMGGEGFVRFNFGGPRVMLIEGLQRMVTALETYTMTK
jgi:cystathionine beta-lyase